MRRRKKYRYFVLVVALAAMLTLAGTGVVADGAPLFPLRPGSSWLYVTDSGDDAGLIEVMAPQRGGPGFVVRGYWGFFDQRTLRGNNKDTVMEVRPDGSEGLHYLLDAPVGTSWKMHALDGFCVDGSTLTVGARDLIMTVPAGTFEGVVRVDHATRCFDGGLKTEWFAPGIGLIQRTSLTFFGERTIALLRAQNVPGVE